MSLGGSSEHAYVCSQRRKLHVEYFAHSLALSFLDGDPYFLQAMTPWRVKNAYSGLGKITGFRFSIMLIEFLAGAQTRCWPTHLNILIIVVCAAFTSSTRTYGTNGAISSRLFHPSATREDTFAMYSCIELAISLTSPWAGLLQFTLGLRGCAVLGVLLVGLTTLGYSLATSVTQLVLLSAGVGCGIACA